MRLSVVIPVFNEFESIPHLYARLSPVLAAITDSHEIVFVDDGSSDSSVQVISDLVDRHPEVVLVRHRSNFGKSVAMNTGFNVARGEVIFTMDADLQDEPTEIPKLLSRIEEGNDLVVGLRSNRSTNDPLSKIIPSRVANYLTRVVSGLPLRDMNSGLKAYRRELASKLRLHGGLHRYVPVLAHYKGYKICEESVSHNPRQYGHSKYGPSRFLSSLFDLLTVFFLSRFRYRPLHLFGTVGGVASVLGLLIFLYLGGVWVFTDDPIGKRPLLTFGVVLVVVGVQFASLGLITELMVSMEREREDPHSPVLGISRHSTVRGSSVGTSIIEVSNLKPTGS